MNKRMTDQVFSNGLLKLAYKMLVMAIEDLDDPKYQHSAKFYIESTNWNWQLSFCNQCSVLGMSPYYVRHKILNGSRGEILQRLRELNEVISVEPKASAEFYTASRITNLEAD